MSQSLINQHYKKLISQLPDSVLKKGDDLFKSGQIVLNQDYKENLISVNVPGNIKAFYPVEFKVLKTKINASCHCLYYEENNRCKHIVAGLLFLINNNKEANKNSGKQSDRRINSSGTQQIEIPKDYKDLNWLMPFIDKKSAKNFDVKSAEINEGKLNFEIKEYSNFRFSGSNVIKKPVIYRKDNFLFTKCNCNTAVKKCCLHESSALLWLINNYKEDIFNRIDPEYISVKKKERLKELNIQVETDEVDHYLREVLSTNGIELIPHQKAEGLYNLKEVANVISEKLNNFNSPEKKFGFGFSSDTKNLNDGFNCAFVLTIRSQNDYPGVSLKLIKGKPDKQGKKLSTSLSVINPYSDLTPSIPLNTHDCFQLVNLINKEIYYKNSFDNKILSQVFLNTQKLLQDLSENTLFYSNSEIYSNVRKTEIIETEVLTTEASLEFELEEEDHFYRLEAKIKINDDVLIKLSEVRFNHPFIGIFQDKLFHLVDFKTYLSVKFFREVPVYRTTKDKFDSFFDEIISPLQKEFPLAVKNKNEEQQKSVQLKPAAKRIYISEYDKFIIFKPEIFYENDHLTNFLEPGNKIIRQANTVLTLERDLEFENAFEDEVRSLHPSFRTGGRQGFFNLSIDEMTKNYWFLNAFEKLKNCNIEVWGLNQLKNFKYSVHKPDIQINFESRKDWFETKIQIAFGDSSVTINELKKALKEDRNYVLLDDGTYGMLPVEWLTKFRQLLRTGKEDGEKIKISKLNFQLLEQFSGNHLQPDILNELLEKKEKLKAFKGIEKTPVPAQITATLRDYQKEGLNWMNFLDEFGWGGILADDMGLGKTLQVITFLQAQKNIKRGLNLVVAPTSLLFNWHDELKKFAPELNFHLHYGNDRKTDIVEFKKSDLVITSYGTLCNDLDAFSEIKFNYVILDESQAIKNVTSLRYSAVCSLKAENRIAMTGTPVENSTLELFAQMNFINPGFLHNLNHFKENYVKAIETEQNKDRTEELKSRIAPFILRRTKKEVLTELPDKTEETLYCIMSDGQRKVYDAYRNKYRNQLLGLIETEGLSKNVFQVLEGLTKLRQICDSPQLLEDDKLSETASVKIAELKRHIAEKTGNHKILIFSQFVKMLKLIEKELQNMGVKYEYLDGQTQQKNRETKVKNFQNDDSCRIFLISLKAGGVGLNLTEADYVYIVDPWWNPAVENQAIDRCYRMGQKKNVTALRMICKDTIEERIFELQQEKKNLSDNLLDGGEGVIKNLTKEDIEKLFS